MKITEQVERMIVDFKHGGKLGPRSTERLLDVVLQLARAVDQLRPDRSGDV